MSNASGHHSRLRRPRSPLAPVKGHLLTSWLFSLVSASNGVPAFLVSWPWLLNRYIMLQAGSGVKHDRTRVMRGKNRRLAAHPLKSRKPSAGGGPRPRGNGP
ncbi:hypothetical protein D3C72_1258600 [compost metagenome]